MNFRAARKGALFFCLLFLLSVNHQLWDTFANACEGEIISSKLKKLKSAAFSVFVSLFLISCTAGPELAKYPRTEINRPYTLPKGVATWETIAGYFYAQDSSGSAGLPPIPVPLFWTTALSDNINWKIPFQLSFQLSQTENQLLGLDAGLQGLGYASGSIGFVINPGATFFYRRKLAKNIALDASLAANVTYYTGNGSTNWDLGIKVGPRFQVSDFYSILPAVGVTESYGNFPMINSTAGPTQISATVLPLSLSMRLSATRQWDLGASYEYRAIGAPNQYSSHSGELTATHYW